MIHIFNNSVSKLAPRERSRGYTLLFAMIVASVVLALGVSLLDVSRKEFALSSSATESSSAFYAADSGVSCAEYWDSSSAFASSTYGPGATGDAVVCDSSQALRPVMITAALPGQSYCPAAASTCYEFAFAAPFSTTGGSSLSGCASTTVDKYYESDPDFGGAVRAFTTITSAGFNIGWSPGDCSLTSPRKVNRTVQLTY